MRENMTKKYFVVVLAVVLVSLAASCELDSECVPSSCCHAKSCVARDSAEDESRCDDVMCSAQCIPFTLDCGGVCRCDNETNACTSMMRSGFAPVGGPTKAPEPPKNKRTIRVMVRTTVKK